MVAEENSPRSWLNEPSNHPKNCGLAASRRSKQKEKRTRRNFDTDIFNRDRLIECLSYVGQAKACHA
jgi:hypothetical protein